MHASRFVLVAVTTVAAIAGRGTFAQQNIQLDELPYDTSSLPSEFPLDVAARLNAQPDAMTTEDTQSTGQPEPSGFDAGVVAAGRAAFSGACTQCHDAERSLDRRKDLGGWLATVRRMAAKEDAGIPSSEITPIATYLASLNPAATAGGDGGAAAIAGQSYSLFSTVSTVHRSGPKTELQNPGFFPEVWFGAEWQTDTPMSARVNACVTCHSEPAGGGSRIEIAEGFMRFDVLDYLMQGCPRGDNLEVNIDAGRFIVPFGGFAARSHPGAFRTATRPLIYNMGQLVYRGDIGASILPMPYSDEGAVLSAEARLIGEVTTTLDAYVVNGLQGTTSLDFFRSRDYVDNNSDPAVGGRATLGNRYIRAGGSIMSGRFNEIVTAGPLADYFGYVLYGADLTARYEDIVRVHLEYANRVSNAFDFTTFMRGEEELDGFFIEGEVLLIDRPRISFVAHYDEQVRIRGPALAGSTIPTGTFGVRRMVWGLNFTMPGGALLIVNHERWKVPDPLIDLDVLAIRWVGSF